MLPLTPNLKALREADFSVPVPPHHYLFHYYMCCCFCCWTMTGNILRFQVMDVTDPNDSAESPGNRPACPLIGARVKSGSKSLNVFSATYRLVTLNARFLLFQNLCFLFYIYNCWHKTAVICEHYFPSSKSSLILIWAHIVKNPGRCPLNPDWWIYILIQLNISYKTRSALYLLQCGGGTGALHHSLYGQREWWKHITIIDFFFAIEQHMHMNTVSEQTLPWHFLSTDPSVDKHTRLVILAQSCSFCPHHLLAPLCLGNRKSLEMSASCL